MKTEEVKKVIRLSSYKSGNETKYCVQRYDGMATFGPMWGVIKRGTLEEIMEFSNGEDFKDYEKVSQL